MRISRLHVLLLLIAGGVGGYMAYEQGWMPGFALKPPPAPGSAPTPVSPPGARVQEPPPAADNAAKPPAPPAEPAHAPADAHEVMRGDTLWAIARDISPVRAGAGWVGIWKANQGKIRDFDRLEPGWRLAIPQTREAYATRFWKPSRFELARWPGEVDLAQLPVPGRPGRIDLAAVLEAAAELRVAALPAPEDSDAYAFAVEAFRYPAPSWLPRPVYR